MGLRPPRHTLEDNVHSGQCYRLFSSRNLLRLITPSIRNFSGGRIRTEQFPSRQRPSSFSVDQAVEKARKQEAAMAKAIGRGVK